jgi:hypothetical protein
MQYGMSLNEYSEFCSRKLAHYNKWLLDPKREPGKTYGGFPEEQQLLSGKKPKKVAVEVAPEPVVVAKKAKVEVKSKPKKAKRMSGETPTKQQLALAIFNRIGDKKQEVIAAIIAEIGMTPLGAQTYYYNCRKMSTAS